MPIGLKRYQSSGHDHAINFSCYERRPHLETPAARNLFEASLEQARRKYKFEIHGYVVMPDHVHLLVSEPESAPLATAIQALKVSVSKRSLPRPFWEARYYDFNVITRYKFLEKLRYLHRNPVASGLVEAPEDWPHSSYRTWLNREQRTVFISLH